MRDSKGIKTNRSQATMHPGSRPTDTPLAPLSEVGMLDDHSTPLLKIPATSKLALHHNNVYGGQNMGMTFESHYPKNALLERYDR